MSFICLRTVDCEGRGGEPRDERVVLTMCRASTYLARLSSTQQQHLYLVLRQLSVALELVLNLVIAYGASG
jgi:hypothetical protein